MARANTVERRSLLDNYVFMDKTFNALEVALKTQKNLILFGPGGHGKSEFTYEYLVEKGIEPYVISWGKGMTIERLFGGIDIKEYERSGKIQYLVENSFMNHEYVIFEEMLDGGDHILEQTKDILSSGQYRNGSQVFDIKCKLIIACTNRDRSEFAKSTSLKALMERFPLEHHVIWDNYTEIAYNTLLERRFGVNCVDPIIPYLLQEFTSNGITISPRIALDTYDVFEECGADSLLFIAEFAKRPSLINETLAKFQDNIRFKQLGAEIQDLVEHLTQLETLKSQDNRVEFVEAYKQLSTKVAEVKSMTVSDDMAQQHAALKTAGNTHLDNLRDKYVSANAKVFAPPIEDLPKREKPKKTAKAKTTTTDWSQYAPLDDKS